MAFYREIDIIPNQWNSVHFIKQNAMQLSSSNTKNISNTAFVYATGIYSDLVWSDVHNDDDSHLKFNPI